MALQWLRINGSHVIGDLQRFLLHLHECLYITAVTRPKQMANCLQQMVSPWLRMMGWPWALKCDTVIERGPDFNTKSGRQKHSQAWSTGSECCRLDKSGIFISIARTCKVSFSMALNIHHVETQQIRLCLLHECLEWLSLGQNNWPIFYSTWLCNGFASMVLTWLGICNVSCCTYMNVSNGCHSAKTTGQLPVTNGFTVSPWLRMTGWPWALDSRHHSWPSLSQKVWYCHCDRK